MQVKAYAAHQCGGPMKPHTIERRDIRDNDVEIEIMYSGICHSDLHQINNDWGGANYPLVPGHEIAGKVTKVGKNVTEFKVGDHAAVGCFVDSCLECDQCEGDHEQYCREEVVQTYSSKDPVGPEKYTSGGFSTHIVVREHFVLKVDKSLDLSKVPPMVCAGITTFSPLKEYNIGKGSRVGVIGIGGLGHMAVQLAAGLGAEVTAITRSNDKAEEIDELGAKHSLLSTDKKAMKEAAGSFDLIIDTVPVKHDLDPYISLLDVRGVICIVGQLGDSGNLNTGPLVFGERKITGSLVGGIKLTQEVIDFCRDKQIYPMCESINMENVNDALKRLEEGDVHYRFVIDMASMKDQAA